MHELGTLARQTWLVFGRSLRAGLREPALAFVFPLAFPLLIIGLFSQVYSRVADLPGFPAGSYLGWMTPAVVLMAAMFGAGHSALGLVRDLQTGFLDRLRLLPIRPAALMLGRLGFDMARVTAAGFGVLAAAVALGAPLRGGPLAVIAIAALLAGWALGYAGLYYVVGLRARSPEALTALVPLFLPISLLSTAYVPAGLLPGWVQAAAAANPYSHVVDSVRAAMAGTLDAGQLVAGWPRWPPPSPSPNWRPPGASPASSAATDPTVAGRAHSIAVLPQPLVESGVEPCDDWRPDA